MSEDLEPSNDRELRIARAACDAMIKAWVPTHLENYALATKENLYPLPPRLRTWTDGSGNTYRVLDDVLQIRFHHTTEWISSGESVTKVLALADLLKHPTEEEK